MWSIALEAARVSRVQRREDLYSLTILIYMYTFCKENLENTCEKMEETAWNPSLRSPDLQIGSISLINWN